MMIILRTTLSVVALLVSLCGEAKVHLPDSLLSLHKAYSYNLRSIDTSLAIVRTMRERKLAEAWELNIVEGDMYKNVMQVQRALPFYERALAVDGIGDSIRMDIYSRLIDAYDVLFRDDKLMYYIYQLNELAEKHNSSYYRSVLEFIAGKRLHYHGEKQKGCEMCLRALGDMVKRDYPQRICTLCEFYTDLTSMYQSDGQYDEALRYSALQEAAVRELLLTGSPQAASYPLCRVYALRASILAKAGRMEEADLAYSLWLHTDGGNPVYDSELLDYLFAGRHYEEALEILNSCRTHLKDIGDEISFWHLQVIFWQVQAMAGLHRYDETIDELVDADLIADSLKKRASQSEMQTYYQLLEEQKKLNRRNLMFNWILFFVVLLIIIVGLVIYFSRIVRQRNRVVRNMLRGLDAYRHMTEKEAAVGKQLSDENLQPSPATDSEVEPDANPQAPAIEDTGKELDEDERLFVEMDRQVTGEQLFLQPDLDREKLMRLIGVDKNRFGRMMSKYATNASVYINTKRVEYGAKMLAEHPEYTIAFITEACGMRNTVTFNRSFKDFFGVTPSEYRASLSESASRAGGGGRR